MLLVPASPGWGFWRDSARAKGPKRLPVMPKRSQVRPLSEGMNGSQHLMVYLLYGTRMRRPRLPAHASRSPASNGSQDCRRLPIDAVFRPT
jgi:hypothetical protein